MFIQILETPNPNTMKFVPGIRLLDSGQTHHFDNAEQCVTSPLAAAIMEVQSVERIMLAEDFIAVSKKESAEWHTTKTLVVAAMIDHLMLGRPILAESVAAGSASSSGSADDGVERQHLAASIDGIESDADPELIEHIKALIEEKVRPAVAQDGGDIDFVAFKDGIVYLRMRGACSGCPSSSYTLKNGIENMLKHYVPEVMAVEKWEE